MKEDKKHEGGESGSSTPSSKRPRRRVITVAVVAAIAVVAVAGLWTWHEQPSFCNAICHTPMDGYLETYEATAGAPAVDKYGQVVTDASGMMASTHRTQGDATCMGCHVPSLGEQISEGLSWASGSYSVFVTEAGNQVVPEKSLNQLTAARGIDGEGFCLNDACHADAEGKALTREGLKEKTRYLSFNPHSWYHEEEDCGDCHKAHRASVYTCAECHNVGILPDGWTAKGQDLI